MCLCPYLCVVMCMCNHNSLEESIESPGAGVTGASELSSVDAGTKLRSSVRETKALTA